MSLLGVWAAREEAHSAVRTFADGRCVVHGGDCLEVLKGLADASIDSVVTDPPYALVSVVKRFGREGSAPAKHGTDGLYARQSRGFMGKEWDNGDHVHLASFWVEVLRVLKPGGHMVAFAGTRTYHRMAVAIEDAGFEIRDQLAWVYGSGFPKSHDVSKGIDKNLKAIELFEVVRAHIREWRDAAGLSNDQLNDIIGSANSGCGMARHWTSEEGGQHSIPSLAQWQKLKAALTWPDCELDVVYAAVKNGAERPVLGEHASPAHAATWRIKYLGGQTGSAGAITGSATNAAKQWEGWGTALKPAWEPICLARKPLMGTVAANVLEHGVGALNVDGCRVGDEPITQHGRKGDAFGFTSAEPAGRAWTGRWPANLLHDGSDEVVGCFPMQKPSKPGSGGAFNSGRHGGEADLGPNRTAFVAPIRGHSDAGGSAARFFFAAPTSQDELLFSRAKAKMQEWNSDLASTADDNSCLSNELVGFVLKDVVTWVSLGASVVSRVESLKERFTSVTPLELRRISEASIITILSLECGFSQELLHEKRIRNNSLVKCVVVNGQTGTMQITISHWKSDGSAEPVTFDIMPQNWELGARDCEKRFMYAPKASAKDRAGSKHPTVKPVSLMRWLCRLITPPGGTVLDPFAGSGTTGQAALEEGFKAVLVEREKDYLVDIAERLRRMNDT